MKSLLTHPLDKLILDPVPLNAKDKQFLMEALEAAALTLSELTLEKVHETKSTRN